MTSDRSIDPLFIFVWGTYWGGGKVVGGGFWAMPTDTRDSPLRLRFAWELAATAHTSRTLPGVGGSGPANGRFPSPRPDPSPTVELGRLGATDYVPPLLAARALQAHQDVLERALGVDLYVPHRRHGGTASPWGDRDAPPPPSTHPPPAVLCGWREGGARARGRGSRCRPAGSSWGERVPGPGGLRPWGRFSSQAARGRTVTGLRLLLRVAGPGLRGALVPAPRPQLPCLLSPSSQSGGLAVGSRRHGSVAGQGVYTGGRGS